MLVEFWTYTCYNCQNAQPHINALYDKYRDDGLLVVGIHSPEFGFEKDISIVRKAVGQANIEYPVVLDNNYAIWNVSGRHGTSSTPTVLSATGISARAPTTRQITAAPVSIDPCVVASWHETVFEGSEIEGALGRRRRNAQGGGRQDLLCFDANHKALAKATKVDGGRGAESDPRQACQERGDAKRVAARAPGG